MSAQKHKNCSHATRGPLTLFEHTHSRDWLEVNYGGYLKRTWSQQFEPVSRINLILEGAQ